LEDLGAPVKVLPSPANLRYSTFSIKHLPHHLHGYRRKPAITNLDKPFTPNHKLNQHFAT